jgi:hypothetical protein
MTFCSGTISKIIPLTARSRSFVASDQLTALLTRWYCHERHRESGTRTYTTFKASAVRVIPVNQQYFFLNGGTLHPYLRTWDPFCRILPISWNMTNRGFNIYDKIRPIWAPILVRVCRPVPENPDNPLFSVPVENMPIFRFVCRNTTGNALSQSPPKALESRHFSPRILLHPDP